MTPYKIISKSPKDTIPVDGTRFACQNRFFENGAIDIDYPASAAATRAASGNLVLDAAPTFGLRGRANGIMASTTSARESMGSS
jgi:hypothetical protein